MNKKIAIITGGSSGIGLAIAQELVKKKIYTIIVSRDLLKLKKAFDVLEKSQTNMSKYIRCDITSGEFVNNMVEKVIAEFGQIDILVNCAGVSIHGEFKDLTERDWDEVIDTNLKGIFNCCKAVWNTMLESKKGKL